MRHVEDLAGREDLRDAGERARLRQHGDEVGAARALVLGEAEPIRHRIDAGRALVLGEAQRVRHAVGRHGALSGGEPERVRGVEVHSQRHAAARRHGGEGHPVRARVVARDDEAGQSRRRDLAVEVGGELGRARERLRLRGPVRDLADAHVVEEEDREVALADDPAVRRCRILRDHGRRRGGFEVHLQRDAARAVGGRHGRETETIRERVVARDDPIGEPRSLDAPVQERRKLARAAERLRVRRGVAHGADLDAADEEAQHVGRGARHLAVRGRRSRRRHDRRISYRVEVQLQARAAAARDRRERQRARPRVQADLDGAREARGGDLRAQQVDQLRGRREPLRLVGAVADRAGLAAGQVEREQVAPRPDDQAVGRRFAGDERRGRELARQPEEAPLVADEEHRPAERHDLARLGDRARARADQDRLRHAGVVGLPQDPAGRERAVRVERARREEHRVAEHRGIAGRRQHVWLDADARRDGHAVEHVRAGGRAIADPHFAAVAVGRQAAGHRGNERRVVGDEVEPRAVGGELPDVEGQLAHIHHGRGAWNEVDVDPLDGHAVGREELDGARVGVRREEQLAADVDEVRRILDAGRGEGARALRRAVAHPQGPRGAVVRDEEQPSAGADQAVEVRRHGGRLDRRALHDQLQQHSFQQGGIGRLVEERAEVELEDALAEHAANIRRREASHPLESGAEHDRVARPAVAEGGEAEPALGLARREAARLLVRPASAFVHEEVAAAGDRQVGEEVEHRGQLEQLGRTGHDVDASRLRHDAIDHAARARRADQQVVDAVAVEVGRGPARQRAERVELELASQPRVRLRQHERLPGALGRGEEDVHAAFIVAVQHLAADLELARRLADDEVHAAVGVQVSCGRLQRPREHVVRLQRRRAVARDHQVGVLPREGRRQVRAAEEHE